MSFALGCTGGGSDSSPRASSALTAEAPATEAPREIEGLRLELELARQGGLYLVVRPEVPVLEIRARGLVLDSVPLSGVALLIWRHPGESPPERAPLPRLWRIEGQAPAASRRFITPSRLRPWEAGEEAGGEEVSGSPPTAAEVPAAEPSRYTLELEGGWELRVTDELPPRGWLSRFRESFEDGWRYLWGRQRSHPHQIVLALDAQRARALHHLFRPGLRVVVAGSFP